MTEFTDGGTDRQAVYRPRIVSHRSRRIDIVPREHDLLLVQPFPMRRQFLAAISFIALTAALPLAAQAPDASEQQQLVALVKEIQAQQAQIADNQTKIETKLAELAEAIRVARLFAGKAGK